MFTRTILNFIYKKLFTKFIKKLFKKYRKNVFIIYDGIL